MWRKTGYRLCRAGSGVGGMTRATSKAVPGPPALAGFKPHSQFKGICFLQTVHETTGDGLNGCTERAPQGFFDFGGQSHVLNGRYVVFVGSRAWSLPYPVAMLGASSQLTGGGGVADLRVTPRLACAAGGGLQQYGSSSHIPGSSKVCLFGALSRKNACWLRKRFC